MRITTFVKSGLAITALAAPLAISSTTSGASTPAPAKAKVTVIHGIPGVAVDVYVNGKEALKNFKFGTVTHPIALPAGTYKIAIEKHGNSLKTKPVLHATEKLTAGENATIVADLTATGTPSLAVFANPTTKLASGQTRIIVRHTAEAPGVDVYAGTSKVITDLVNGQSQTLTIPAATGVPVAVTVTGGSLSSPVLGPVSLNFPAATTTIVYAIGSASGHTLKAVVQTYAS